MSVSSNLFISNPATPSKPQTYPAGTATGSAERRFSQLLDGYAPTDPVTLRAALPAAPPPPPAPLPVAKDIERHTDPIPPPAPTARQAEPANAPRPETAAAKPAAPAPAPQTPARTANGKDGKAPTPAKEAAKDAPAGTVAEEKTPIKLINKRRNEPDLAPGADLTALNTPPAAPTPITADAATLAAAAGQAGQAEQADVAEPVVCQASEDGSTAAAPATLATLMPTVAQAVFGQAAGTKGDATLPDALNAKTQDAATARGPAAGRALPAGAEPLAAAAGKDAARADALLSASADSTAALAAGDKGPAPAASATGFSTLLQAASAMPGMAPAATQGGAQASAPSVPVHVGTPLHDPNFAPEMAARLTVLASDGVQQAELHLNPADMGPVSVNIQVDGQQAQVSFHAQHEATREVLERSLPELAAALRDAGMTLSGGGVFQQQQQARDGSRQDGQASNGGNSGHGQNGGSDNQLAGAGAENTRPARRAQVGVIDTYA